MTEEAHSLEAEASGESQGISTGQCWRSHLLAREGEKGWHWPRGWEEGCNLSFPCCCCRLLPIVREDRGKPCLPGWQLSNGSKAH